MIHKSIVLFFLSCLIGSVFAGTSITVIILLLIDIFFFIILNEINVQIQNLYKKEVNVKIQGAGIGGCDIILQAGETNNADCWCLWGTVNYSFCSYVPSKIQDQLISNNSSEVDSKNGKCPIVTGESLLCSDLSSLGNCYDGSYSCVIDSSGLCSCKDV